MEWDAIDAHILNLLQEDASLSIQDVAEQVGLSSTPCWRRIKRLESVGVIERRVVIVNQLAVGLGGTVFVAVRTSRHDANWLRDFADAVVAIPEIVECHRLTGDIDYLLKCVVRDIEHYDSVYRRLIGRVDCLVDVTSSFSMERLKHNSKLDMSTARKPLLRE